MWRFFYNYITTAVASVSSSYQKQMLVSMCRHSYSTITMCTHMTVEDDGPYKAENDGRPSIYDIWDVYVHQFDLHQPTVTKVNNKTHRRFKYHVFWCVWKLTDFFLRKFSAVSMLALCWKTPWPLCLFCGDNLQYCDNNIQGLLIDY